MALRALAAEPGLWARHVEQSGYDKLLFRTEDFAAERPRRLYADLKNSPDREVRRLARILWAAAAGDMGESPGWVRWLAALTPCPSPRGRGKMIPSPARFPRECGEMMALTRCPFPKSAGEMWHK